MQLAVIGSVGVSQIEDVIAWQLADQFKREVYDLIRANPSARADTRFKEQLSAAAASAAMNIAAGFFART